MTNYCEEDISKLVENVSNSVKSELKTLVEKENRKQDIFNHLILSLPVVQDFVKAKQEEINFLKSKSKLDNTNIDLALQVYFRERIALHPATQRSSLD